MIKLLTTFAAVLAFSSSAYAAGISFNTVTQTVSAGNGTGGIEADTTNGITERGKKNKLQCFEIYPTSAPSEQN